MIFQNELDKSINKIACYYTSIAFYSAWKGYYWTARDLNMLWYQCVNKNYIDVNQCILNPQGVANVVGSKLIFKGKYYPDYVRKQNDYIISCFKLTREAEEAHFCVLDESGIYTKEHVLFDPWAGGSKTVAEGLCTSLRVFSKE